MAVLEVEWFVDSVESSFMEDVELGLELVLEILVLSAEWEHSGASITLVSGPESLA